MTPFLRVIYQLADRVPFVRTSGYLYGFSLLFVLVLLASIFPPHVDDVALNIWMPLCLRAGMWIPAAMLMLGVVVRFEDRMR
jgi:hypothetical protein